jgi:hypothetical protein
MRVKSVKKTKKRCSVYDLEVQKYHNFSIQNGVIVHNSIDAVRYGMQKWANRRGH